MPKRCQTSILLRKAISVRTPLKSFPRIFFLSGLPPLFVSRLLWFTTTHSLPKLSHSPTQNRPKTFIFLSDICSVNVHPWNRFHGSRMNISQEKQLPIQFAFVDGKHHMMEKHRRLKVAFFL